MLDRIDDNVFDTRRQSAVVKSIRAYADFSIKVTVANKSFTYSAPKLIYG